MLANVVVITLLPSTISKTSKNSFILFFRPFLRIRFFPRHLLLFKKKKRRKRNFRSYGRGVGTDQRLRFRVSRTARTSYSFWIFLSQLWLRIVRGHRPLSSGKRKTNFSKYFIEFNFFYYGRIGFRIVCEFQKVETC